MVLSMTLNIFSSLINARSVYLELIFGSRVCIFFVHFDHETSNALYFQVAMNQIKATEYMFLKTNFTSVHTKPTTVQRDTGIHAIVR